METTPLILVLGFLGSGKTSFIRHLVHSGLKDRHPAVIQNEFAAAGIDAEILRNENTSLRILEINGGSVFCACRMDQFIPALSAFMTTYRPGILLLEASGMSDPLSLVEILTAPALKEKIFYSGTVCLTDSRHFMALQKMNGRVSEQVRISDIVLLNKTDLATSDQIRSSEQKIREINPFCRIIPSAFGQVDLNGEEFRSINNYYLMHRQKASGSSGLTTGVIRSSLAISREGLDRFLSQFLPATLRMKGFVNLDNGETVMVQATGEEKQISPYHPYSGPTQLIAIGENLDARAFSKAFREACKPPLEER